MMSSNNKNGSCPKAGFENERQESSSGFLLDDFTMVASLGNGSYGEVVLVQRKADNKQYALKIIDKAFMKRENKEYQADAEREILTKLSHSGVVKLHSTFEDKQKLYFLMDYLGGGTLSEHLKAQEGYIGDDAARSFAAEIVSILEYLHNNGIAHRDLKPENLMLTEAGHLKVIDFGTAKTFKQSEEEVLSSTIDRRSTFVGTAYYVSPELLEENLCSAPADLWALGCIIFLMTTGKLPFDAPNEYLVFQQIKQTKIQWPSQMDLVAKDLIEKLLCRNPLDRIGAGVAGSKNDYKALKTHPYFKGIKFETLFNQESRMLTSTTQSNRTSFRDSLPLEFGFPGSKRPKSLILGNEVKVSLQEILSVPLVSTNFNIKEYKVLLTGRVDKRSKYMFYQLRQLVLTDEPRLKYLDPSTNQFKKEIPITRNTRAELESKTKFFVIVPTPEIHL